VNIAPAIAAVALLAAPGCRDFSPAGAKDAPSLAAALRSMPAQARLDTLRALSAARPDDAQIAFHFGNAYYEYGSGLGSADRARALAYFDSATAAYRRAVDIDSTFSRAWVNMGLAYQDAGNRLEARRALETAIQVNPHDVLAYCHLGYLEQSMGNVASAIEQYRRALSIDPNSAQAHYNLGLAFAEARIFREALLEWEAAIRLDPDGDIGKTAAENVRIIRQYLEAEP
jgi:tetratricopeptide (TPR) repeat protein